MGFKYGGPLTDHEEHLYIERGCDFDAIEQLRMMNYVMFIESRQQGKTSLINHLVHSSRLSNYAFAFIYLPGLEHRSSETWYSDLAHRLLEQLKTALPHLHPVGKPTSSSTFRTWMKEVARTASDSRRKIAVGLDEISMESIPVEIEFFSILRDIYNSRQFEPEFRSMTFILAGVFDQYELIRNKHNSPFNVAKRVRLDDFTLEQTRHLLSSEKWPFDVSEIDQLADGIAYWTGGQPYLTQMFASYAHKHQVHDISLEEVMHLWQNDDNLIRPLVKQLQMEPKLIEDLIRVVSNGPQLFSEIVDTHRNLALVGIMKRGTSGHCQIRNPLYEKVFETILSSRSSDLPLSKLTKLTGRQFRDFQEALLSAFDLDTLKQMIRIELGEDPDAIIGEHNLSKQVYDLLMWAEKHGRLDDLLNGALSAVPSSNPLRLLAATFGRKP